MRGFQGFRPSVLHRVNSKNNLFGNQINLGCQNICSSLSIQERKDGVILDGIGLSSFPDSRASSLIKLSEKGLYINAIDKRSNEDLNIETADINYELHTLANINIAGFHARSYLVFPENDPSLVKPPSSMRIAFGGTQQLSDTLRTTGMFLSKRPFIYEKQILEFLDKTLEKYHNKYEAKKLPAAIVISAHSAGSTHAIKAYGLLKDKLREKGINSEVMLRLYEPFGAKYSDYKPKENENIVSYISENSFLSRLRDDGRTIGHTITLPASSRQKYIDGTIIGVVEKVFAASFLAHTLLWIVDSHIDKNASSDIAKNDSLESLVSFTNKEKQSKRGMSR